MAVGKFIAIEGPDGSGKGTQQKLLLSRMEEQGIQVVSVDFPQYETSLFGKLVGQMLSGEFGSIENIHPKLASVMYAADRYKASSFIRESQDNGVNVVANRYTLSNMAHQSARLPESERASFISFLQELEYTNSGFEIPKPDLYIHLSLPVEITQELVLKKAERAYLNGEKKDALESDLAHQIEAAKMYHYLASILPEIVTIDCCSSEGSLLPIEHIQELVWEKARHVFSPELREGMNETNELDTRSFVHKERR